MVLVVVVLGLWLGKVGWVVGSVLRPGRCPPAVLVEVRRRSLQVVRG